MSSETHNNNIKGWRNSLDQLERLPDDVVSDSNALWQKLYVRLSHNKESKKRGWYWLAAAVLAFVVTASVFFLSNRSTRIKTNSRPVVVQSNRPQEQTTDAKKKIAATNITLTEKKTASAKHQRDKKVDKMIAQNKALLFRLHDTVSLPGSLNAILADTIKAVSLPAGLAVNSSLKQKLKVVHVNELGDKIEPASSIEPNASLHYFRLKFASQEVYMDAPTSREKSVGILKLKTP